MFIEVGKLPTSNRVTAFCKLNYIDIILPPYTHHERHMRRFEIYENDKRRYNEQMSATYPEHMNTEIRLAWGRTMLADCYVADIAR